MNPRYRSVIYLTIFIMISILFNVSQLTIVKADETSKNYRPDQDTFVSQASPDENYGSNDLLFLGADDSGYSELYIQFSWDEDDVPGEITQVSLRLSVSYHAKDHIITLSEINETWSDNTITWNNRPLKSSEIGTWSIDNDDSGFIYHNITDIVSDIEDFSICLHIKPENFVNETLQFVSSDDDFGFECPVISVSYIYNLESWEDPFPHIVTIIILIITISAFLFLFIKIRNKRHTTRFDGRVRSYKLRTAVRPIKPPKPVTKRVKTNEKRIVTIENEGKTEFERFCIFCGAGLNDEKHCEYCGTGLKGDAKHCKYCGAGLEGDAKHCIYCGMDL